MIKHRIARYIEKEGLFSLNDKILVALSGGADSVTLLRMLLCLGYTCEAAHCNFRLRGEESDRDESFVHQLCCELDVPLHLIHFDTKLHAEENKISIEMAARDLRYNWFEELREKYNFSVVAVAHHRDDSAETMLLNLIRGTGLTGLLGIHPKNGCIVRPLLCISRKEIIDYLLHIDQKYVTDCTNLQDEYTRNKIRLKLIPLMEEINPSVKETLFSTGNHLTEVSAVYRRAITEGIRRVRTNEGIRIKALLAEPSPSALLFEILHPLGFNSTQIEDIVNSLSGQPGKQFTNSKGFRVIRDREFLLLTNAGKSEDQHPPFQLIYEERELTPDFVIPRDKHTACFDTGKLKTPLTVRKWKQGDAFIPFGMTGKKMVSDYLTDRKFSLAQKEEQWVLCSHEHIAWVIGERTDNRFRVDESTRHITLVKLRGLH